MIKPLSIFAALFLVVIPAFAIDYFVAPGGSDTNVGTLEKPLATLQAGVDKLKPGDVLQVRGGLYRERVVFARSGSATQPLTVQAYNGETVQISGGDPVTGWEKVSGNLWKARAAATLGKGKDQLFYRGEAMREARHPNQPEPGLELPVADLNPLWPSFAAFSTQPLNVISGAAARNSGDGSWNGALYYGVHWDGWAAQSAVVANSKKSGALHVEKPTSRWWWDNAKPKPYAERGRGMLVGHRNALDAPGEWLREADGTLLFIVPDGQSPEGAVEMKRRQLAFDLSNQAHIRLRGLRVQGASASLRNSESCVLDSCVFEYFTHFTLFDDARNGEIEGVGNRGALERGEVAVFVGGRRNAVLNSRFSYSAGGGLYVEGYGHTLHNNLIEECSYTCTYLAGIMVGWNQNLLAGGHIITHNTIRRCGRALFHIDGGTQTRNRNPFPFAAMLIANNHLYDGVLQGRDGGVVNSWHTDAGAYNDTRSEFRNNLVHDCYDPMPIEDGWRLGVVYWDNNTQNLDCRANLVWAKPDTVPIGTLFNAPSVNSLWDPGNRFLKNHRGGAATLQASDFPDGKPFAYGHDFIAAPPVPAWGPRVVTEQPLGDRELRPSGTFVQRDVDFGEGARSLVLRYACDDQNLNRLVTPPTLTNAATPAAPATPAGPAIPATSATGPREFIALEAKDAQLSPKLTSRFSIVRNLRQGEYLKLPQLNLGAGYERLYLVWASRNPEPKALELRLDSLEAAPVARFELPDTKADHVFDAQLLHPFTELTFALPPALSGQHNVYLAFTGGGGEVVGQLSFIRFEKYRGTLPLLPNEARLEVRLDRPDGELLTTIFPQRTEGGLCESIGVIENRAVRGRHDLHFVYRTAAPAPLRLTAFRLERGP